MTIPAHVQNRDVQTAQNVLDAWVQAVTERGERDGGYLTSVATADAQTLRGIVAAALADVREAAYLEGMQVGRRRIAHVLWDALDAEGLAVGYSDPKALES